MPLSGNKRAVAIAFVLYPKYDFSMENIIFSFLNMTSWRMDAPQLFSGFHIAASLLAAALAVVAALLVSRRAVSEKRVRKVLAFTGWVLLFLEVYKQLFLYYTVNGQAFDFWYFPFQLCSVPMYLCIFLPLFKKRSRATLMTFMGGYTFVSAAAALIYPEDILRPYIALTAHGFIWHGILLFISLLIYITGCADSDLRGQGRAAVLFLILCMIAVNINIVAEPVMPAIRAAHPAVSHDWAAMFYLNPFHISPQPVIGSIQKTAGIPAGLALYIIAIIIVSSLVNRSFGALSKRSPFDDDEEE